MMKKFVLVYALFAGFLPVLVHAQESPWLEAEFWQTATFVAGPRTVTFRGEEMSLTKATLIILNLGYTPSIAHQWLYEGECLRDVYDRTHPKKC